ncbi:MAG: hypothetical protein ACKOK8_12645, partial [Planctomycetia bacterium]
AMDPDSLEVLPLEPPGAAAAPWVDRAVKNPAVRSGYVSLAAHLLVGILLALLALDREPAPRGRPLVLSIGPPTEEEPAGDRVAGVEIDATSQADASEHPAVQTESGAVPEPTGGMELPLVALHPAGLLPAVEPPADAAGADADGSDPLVDSLPGAGPTAQPVSARGGSSRPASASGRSAGRPVLAVGGTANGNPLASRTGAARAAGVRGHGGNAASEAAVERGLEWLSLHQAVDGSWQFDLSGCRCQGACRDPGTLTSSTASTAIALLPFLGAGHTHLDGRHQETVSRGIYYLLSRMERTPRGADFCEGTMYGHGVTTLVLAEALGMTKDDMLAPAVRDAVRFIETAQDMHSGGWRYLPGPSGDITITAWQLTALKSAQLAGLEAPSPTIDGIRRFLDRVQSQHGAAYGYRTPAAKPCTSAIGLLCRMYTGWGPAEEPLVRGVTTLAKPGPAPEAVYQNFYLSQALLQLTHPAWPRWNQK